MSDLADNVQVEAMAIGESRVDHARIGTIAVGRARGTLDGVVDASERATGLVGVGVFTGPATSPSLLSGWG